jgi:transcriptional regulator with XRE-family HTH domain
MNQEQVAASIGIHKAYLSQILHGRRRPGLKNALKIERVTGIPASAWMPIDDGDSDRKPSRDVDLRPVSTC